MAIHIRRREFIVTLSSAAAWPLAARGQTYPSRPVRLIVSAPAGGPADTNARLIGQSLSERLYQTFVIDNRPGAASNIGAESVARAAPDGYTLLFVTAINASNMALYNNLNFNFVRDIAPVAGIERLPFVMVVNPSLPAKTVPEFIIYAKSNPGKINFASDGIGSTTHIAGELFKMMAGIDMIHVPYRGTAPALTDLLGGRVQVYFTPLPGSVGYIKADKLRALAVTTEKRLDLLPDIPTVGDFLDGFEASGWQGIGAPKNTPIEIVSRLNKEINAALADPKIRARLTDLGGVLLTGSPAEFGKLIADDTEKWGKVIRAANIRPE